MFSYCCCEKNEKGPPEVSWVNSEQALTIPVETDDDMHAERYVQEVEALHGKRAGCSFIGPADLDAPWTVKIDRSTGKRMGLAVRHDPDAGLLQVMAILPGDSAVSDWNFDNPSQQVREGDYIVEVNACRTMQGIQLECKKGAVLDVTLRRLLKK
uniref:PDZ domain-containing protein n=1 Tax=Noctiluca scintillans TaxID=2966 RepID=A0A7S1FCU9_NOCSC|mmetsp:Transcript_50774/g.135425  ORF Transcript_50774/g.135425 Transcript_50774/m.135425 type:complete len:155 (+) Transcript_50774:36-500(+)